MKPQNTVMSAAVLVFALITSTACGGSSSATSTTPSTSPPAVAPASSGPAATPTSPAATTTPATGKPGPTKAGEPTVESEDDIVAYEIQYPWAVPAGTVHQSGGDFRGELNKADSGNHPDMAPAYSQVTFRFDDGPPAYSFSYVPQVPKAGQDGSLKLTGSKFLQIVFEVGPLPSKTVPVQTVSLPSIKSFGCGSLSEGKIICGIGTDAVHRIQTAYIVRPGDGSRLQYDIAFYVENG